MIVPGGDALMLKVERARFNTDFDRRCAQQKIDRIKHDSGLEFKKMLKEAVKELNERSEDNGTS